MRIFLLGALVALALPATALAKGNPVLIPIVPPGNSGADQYVENVPTPAGGQPTSGVGAHGHAGSGAVSPIAPGTQAALQRDGRDGRQLSALTRATAPSHSHRHTGAVAGAAGGGSGPGSGGSGGSGSGGSPVSSVLRSVVGGSSGGGAGMGTLLPIILGLCAVGVGGLALRRRLSN